MNSRFLSLTLLILLCLIYFRAFAGVPLQMAGISFDLEEPCTSDLPPFIFRGTNKSSSEKPIKTERTILGTAATEQARNLMKKLLAFESETDQAVFSGYVDRNIAYDNLDEIGVANKGLVAESKFLLENNPCFAILTKSFYAEIQEEQTANRENQTPTRPTITEVTEKDGRSYLKKEWVWKKALKFANDDPQLAFAMLGICGHDDNYQNGELNYGKTRYWHQLKVDKAQPILDRLKKALDRCKREQPTAKSTIKLLEDLSNGTEVLDSGIECPNKTSDFFVPGGLPADISNSLKSRINQSQSKDITFAHKSPPAKYYHVIGSASLVCDLIQRGMTKDHAKRLQILFATLYRVTRNCTSRQHDEQHFKLLETEFAKPNFDDKFVKSLKKGNPDAPLLKEFNEALENLGISLSINDAEDEKFLREQLKSLRAYLVASKIYRERKIDDRQHKRFRDNMEREFGDYGKTVFENLESEKGFDLGDLVKTEVAQASGFTVPDKECIYNNVQMHTAPNLNDKCPSNVSDEICKLAKQKIETWDIDVEWTKQAHAAGGQLAVDKCTKGPSPASNEISCTALEETIKRNQFSDQAKAKEASGTK